MAHTNMIMRDPVLYRIRHAHHYRRGDEWCIYPLYDYTHGLSDAVEDITHSLCTLEFENNREIYDWLLDEVGFEEPRTHQYEFGRMNLEYTIVSKRKLLRLVNEGHVDGWDDPRMPTIAGMRMRGIPPEAIVRFTESVGVAKVNNRVDLAKLEYTIRDELNMTVPRVMGVVDPLRVTITNYPEGEGETLDIPSYPHDVPLEGSRPVPFTREIFIERSDFEEDPPKGFRRLSPGVEVRLRYAYFIRCDEVVKDPKTGEVTELRCTYDPATKGGNAPDGRKVEGTIHWVSATKSIPAEVRLYDRLFTEPDPEAHEGRDFTEFLNPDSLILADGAYVEPSVAEDEPGTRYQFERTGYFTSVEAAEDGGGAGGPPRLVFNRIVTLRDTWGRKRADDAAGAAGGPGGGGRGGVGAVIGESDAFIETPTAPSPRRDRKNVAKECREVARAADPELEARFSRYQEEFGLAEGDADILSGSPALAEFFEGALKAQEGLAPAAVANWVVNELVGALKGREVSELAMEPAQLGSLVALVEKGTISQPVAKDLFQEILEKGGDPVRFVQERGLEKVGDVEALKPLVDKALAGYPDKVQEYRDGKTGLLGFFMGQVMRETGGKADPEAVEGLLKNSLEG
jgi:glutaminyl-tRNA synthetase